MTPAERFYRMAVSTLDMCFSLEKACRQVLMQRGTAVEELTVVALPFATTVIGMDGLALAVAPLTEL